MLQNRIRSIDAVRGLVMIVMALDHVRDMLHLPALTQDPTDLTTTTPALFLTRWITHLCAPTFVFLSGTSAYLSLRRRNDASARWFLLKRGVVLILLELTVVNFAFWFDIHFRTMLLQVIYAIGGGLVLLSLLAALPARWVGLLGLLLVVGHGLLPNLPPTAPQPLPYVWALLFRPGFFPSPAFTLIIGYPLVPWLGIMLAGYGAGTWFEQLLPHRKRLLWRLGLGTLVLFVLLRFLNGYGDPAPWAAQRNTAFTLLSFLNVSKYPPSLLYALLMLGLMGCLLALTDGTDNGVTRWLRVYGAVPMVYYIVHWYLVHLCMIGMVYASGSSLDNVPAGGLTFGRPTDVGVSLPVVYAVWVTLVLVLYPLCRWYGRYKSSHPEIGWLRYV